ncbi:MAG: DEAD/DEAH box helicase family protein [Planctomycetes bacterium]|nr:DEAD/DEAH box helicase family protein [Planctomycetota bacterium]
MSSPFLEIPASEWVASNQLAFAVRDRYPVSPGHTLVVPRRLVPTWFEATAEERLALLDLVDEVKRQLDEAHRPQGYNVGFNAGAAAGQTVFHLHVHVIPRYEGDVPDPRGGVRHVIPARGNYLRPPPLATGGVADPFLRHLSPLFARASRISIVAAFVQESGLDALEPSILDALRRGAHLQVLTGDYLQITQVDALETLLMWGQLRDDEAEAGGGRLEARVVEVERLEGRSASFHPKSWRFEGPGLGVAFVGSSNVSRLALGHGVEWNLRVDRERDGDAYARVCEAFEGLWARAVPLSAGWIAAYRERARAAAWAPLPGEVDEEPLAPPPTPNEVQREALQALARGRAEGHGRALVVLATGLGKTWLAAFDAEAVGQQRGRFPRTLILAHRAELLTQAGRTFRRMLRRSFPEVRTTWCAGGVGDLSGELVLASVQKLSRPDQLVRLEPGAFEYVIVDEVHHADAPSYRRVLDRLQPGFLLGLTATPERADDGDVLGLFDDHKPYEAGIGEGIGRGLLSPFAYFGLKDDVDYTNIPWRNRRFDPAALATAVQTQRRMERLWEAWQAHPGGRTLVFCASIEHANFARDWLRARGVRVEAVHTGDGAADRGASLEALAAGDLDALCAVDLFNEGVDVPTVDRVVMLRPTESLVVFLQQLGRGLRRADGKERLTVVDFVGNHRVFLGRIRALLTLGREATSASVRAFLEGDRAPDLPEGCSVHVDLEAKELLRQLLGPSGASATEQAYRDLVASRGVRPTAAELLHLGYPPSTLRRREHAGWFHFVAAQGDLSEPEQRVLDAADAWLEELETTAMTKCFKMVVLEALLEAEALTTGVELDVLARRSLAILRRSPELHRDLEGQKELPPDVEPDSAAWRAYWRKNPIAAWAGEGRKDGGRRAWFKVEDGRLVPRLPGTPEDEPTLAAMTRELVDYRLAQYRRRRREDAVGSAFECKVLSNQRDPILKLPSRKERPDVPTGEVAVRAAPDGRVWQFRFVKEFCNVARRPGEERNALPDLLRGWFGPAAGRPGTAFFVRFAPTPDGWWAEPAQGQILQLPARGLLRAYPTLQAAAGAARDARTDAPEAEAVRLPTTATGDDVFAVRAAGDSMDGGRQPIHDGDWLVLRFARGAGLRSLLGRVALVQVDDAPDGHAYQVKRIVEEDGRVLLRSDNPARPSFAATAAMTAIATLVEAIPPERLAPPPSSTHSVDALTTAFGLTEPPRTGRVDGHLFLLVTERGLFVAPDRLRWSSPDRRPAETAYVLTPGAAPDTWRYVGVARWLEEERLWTCPDLDHPTWSALGEGRDCSRRLPSGAMERAAKVVDALFERVPAGQWAEHAGRRCRIVERTRSGGVRIDGGADGFKPRTVSLTDVTWVLVAHDDVTRHGGVLDEARVNRRRYLEGTPKASTRWIDTGWAIVLARAAGGLGLPEHSN